MSKATYERGYCRAYAPNDQLIVVRHSAYDTKADIGKAAAECNYLAGNWNESRLHRIGTGASAGGRKVTFYRIVR